MAAICADPRVNHKRVAFELSRVTWECRRIARSGNGKLAVRSESIGRTTGARYCGVRKDERRVIMVAVGRHQLPWRWL